MPNCNTRHIDGHSGALASFPKCAQNLLTLAGSQFPGGSAAVRLWFDLRYDYAAVLKVTFSAECIKRTISRIQIMKTRGPTSRDEVSTNGDLVALAFSREQQWWKLKFQTQYQ